MTLIIENPGERAGIEALWDQYSASPESTHFMALAEQLRRRGCQGEAAEICSRAKMSHPRYVSCRVLLGRCLMELGLKEEAVRELEEVLELDRENAFSLRVMAELKLAQGNLGEAANYYRALVRINPSDLDMQEKLAETVRALGPTTDDQIRPVGQEAVARPPQSPVPEARTRPTVPDIEVAVERALAELRMPGAPVPAWHLEDKAAARPIRCPESRPGPGVPAAPGDEPREPVIESAPRDSLCRQPSEPVQKAPAEARQGGREPVQFFDYANRQSDFSLFAQWVEGERQQSRKESR